MKYILTFLLSLILTFSFAQTVQYKADRIIANKELYIPLRDTNWIPTRSGVLTKRPQDLLVYEYSAGVVGPKWKVIGSSGSGVVSNGNQYSLAYYANNGTTLSPLTILSGNKVVISNINGLPTTGAITSTELNYLSGLNSNVKTSLDYLSSRADSIADVIFDSSYRPSGRFNALGEAVFFSDSIGSTDNKIGVQFLGDTLKRRWLLTLNEANLTLTQSQITGLTSALNGKQGNITFQDEGTGQGSAGVNTTINFTGAGVTATNSVGVLTVNIPGGSGGVTDGDKGDITVSASGATWTIDNSAVTKAKIENVTHGTVIGKNGSSAGTPVEVSVPMVLGTGSVSSQSVFSVDLSSYYQEYDIIEVWFFDVRPVTDGAIARIRLSADGTNYDAGANNYRYAFKFATSTASNGFTGATETYIPASGTGTGVDNSTSTSFHCKVTVYAPNNSAVNPVVKLSSDFFNSTGDYFAFDGGGSRSANQVTRGVQLSFSTGNVSTGKYKIIGIKNN